jgi:hypothetical protein
MNNQMHKIRVFSVCTAICSKHHPGEGARRVAEEKFRGCGAVQEEALVLRVGRRGANVCVNI